MCPWIPMASLRESPLESADFSWRGCGYGEKKSRQLLECREISRSRWLALAALAAVLGVWLGQHSAWMRPQGSQSSGTTAPGAALEPPASASSRPEELTQSIPLQLPTFSLQAMDGTAMTSAQFRGEALLINFWATWCAPCRHEIPLLQSLVSQRRQIPFRVIGIAVDHANEVREFVRRYGVRYPVAVGAQDALDFAASLGVPTPVFPFSVFTDRRHRIIALVIGEMDAARAQAILHVVDEVDAGRLSLTQARSALSANARMQLLDLSG